DTEMHLDLYDDEFTVPLDDDLQYSVEETASSPPEKASELSPPNSKSEAPGTSTSLPAKPSPTDSSAGMSYSAQVARQFSAYQQTPSQERQQRPVSGNPQAGPSAIATHEGPDRAQQDRPIRPSEMKDEGKYFSEFGKVDACTIMRDPDGRSRGFAFLTFDEAESVNAVLARDHMLDGKTIDPKRAIPREEHLRNTRYFVGGLAPTTTAESMREFFLAFGKVVDATVMVDRESGRSKGFGFVTFEDSTNSEQFVGKLGLVLDDKQASPIEVKAAQPRSQRDQARNQAAKRDAYFNDQDSRTPTAPSVALTAQQVGNPAASMIYQRMMGQMPMGGGMGMMNPMMMGMGGMGVGGMGNFGGMGMTGMGMMGGAMNPMAGMNPMAMRMGMGMGGPMAMGMMQPGVGMGMGNMGMRMRQGMGMGAATGMANTGRMAMNSGLGPSRMSTRGQHSFHPYAR
ncbi:hnRNP A1-gamma isoform, partial [Phlebopus sp. FC_14]